MTKTLGVGVIGCGNISAAYMRLAPMFKGIEMRACADISQDAAKARAQEFALDARSIVEKSLEIAGDICIYTNRHITIEVL